MRSSVEPSTIPATSSSPWVIGSLSPARNRVGTCGGVAFGVNGWEPIPTTRERREAESAPGALIIWLIIAVIGSAGAGPPSKKACAASASTAPKGSCGESPPRTMRCTGLGGLRGEVPREARPERVGHDVDRIGGRVLHRLRDRGKNLRGGVAAGFERWALPMAGEINSGDLAPVRGEVVRPLLGREVLIRRGGETVQQ